MTNKTPSYRLKANARYESKVVQKTLRFKYVEDSDLLRAIESDGEPLNSLAKRLLRRHYGLSEKG